MQITPLFVKHLVPELRKELVASKLIAVRHNPDVKELILMFMRESALPGLLFNYDSKNFHLRILTKSEIRKLDYPRADNLFGAVVDATLAAVEQMDFDRIIRFEFQQFHQLWGHKKFFLYYEISANSNLILTDAENGIVDCLRAAPSGSVSKRPIRPGEIYRLPEMPDKIDAHKFPLGDWKRFLRTHSSSQLKLLLSSRFLGVDKFLAEEILFRSHLSGELTAGELTAAQSKKLYDDLTDFFTGHIPVQPTLITDADGFPLLVSPFDFESVDTALKAHTLSLLQAISRYYQGATSHKSFLSHKRELQSAVEKQLRKIDSALEKTDRDLLDSAGFQQYKDIADLLMINKDSISRGVGEVNLDNLFSAGQGKISVELNPELSPLENARQYYRKFQKAKTGLVLLEKRKQFLEGQSARLREILESLRSCRTEEELARLRPLLVKLKIISDKKPASGKKKKQEKKEFRTFEISDGWKVLVGRNNLENDRLTFKTARPHDLWFHASGMAGSHTVLRMENKNSHPSQKTIFETAAIAAYYSKGRNAKKVEVIYTPAKYVRKPKKAAPGLVLVEKEKSALVKPALSVQSVE
ncbi:MAG: NFACT family protein [candidate division Zixibacteria bacterium]|nr:NFACT family protein [candidate division Zixibacteria bacterium]